MLNSIKPVGTRPGTIYELCKVQKQKVDGWPPFKTILTALQTPTYNPAKFLVPILTLWAPTPQNTLQQFVGKSRRTECVRPFCDVGT